MADGNPRVIEVQGGPVFDSDVAMLDIARVRVNSGDTTALGFDIRLDSDDSDAAVNLFELRAGTFVKDLGWFVHTAFTAANVFTIGDSDDADGWAAAARILSTTADTNIAWASQAPVQALVVAATDSDAAHVSDSDLVPPYHAGKLYGLDSDNVTDTQVINMTVGTGGSPAAGQLHVYLMYFKTWGRNRFGGSLDTGNI
jgi:hypothetical protein